MKRRTDTCPLGVVHGAVFFRDVGEAAAVALREGVSVVHSTPTL